MAGRTHRSGAVRFQRRGAVDELTHNCRTRAYVVVCGVRFCDSAVWRRSRMRRSMATPDDGATSWVFCHGGRRDVFTETGND
ncbi:hypothetical protein KCP69_22640 [Salmonella enterica subsp. enterica]|nr:hypothetical protein KCP69_22640 [Salmonella enterica subsp. enterica]